MMKAASDKLTHYLANTGLNLKQVNAEGGNGLQAQVLLLLIKTALVVPCKQK
ncbi:hypothetical protein H4J51_13050 [Colwellia sp. MB02u-18]|uniref:hypothetical protein n=1 Tax=unclassified Colwellia TaxID=196834 RepID=UPI0015F5ADD3|nr:MULTISPECIES: hypothetical protein [unclassified Colwellia]MBA6225495.1 hypothetical protein [Colwellia sp. MB3u-45]MBA6266388.1 hypothetical protein [Colwellia sp. MB3u-43]MBA6320676.1 hypothetical protein [Colwellia sp. MB02u-19]MBA6325498.1 hypothetical protein [Colwellia sp. MB02u-18]MBA6331973.1 hypothetical protein [Colwellia sp. MB02u-12]